MGEAWRRIKQQKKRLIFDLFIFLDYVVLEPNTERQSLIFSFTIVFSLEMVHKPNIFMYKSTLKMTDLQGRMRFVK
jgi:hypothetical protein